VVTARVEAERALAESEARFRAIADNIPQLAWMARPDGRIVWCNRRWFDYTGTTLDEAQGWGWRAVHHPDHVGRVAARFRASVEAGEPWEDTFPLRGRDGEYRWFLSRALPVRDEEGRVALWFGTNTDITEQRLAEMALAQSEARFRALLENSPEKMWVNRPDGSVEWFNAAWRGYTGQPARPEGAEWAEAVHPEDRARMREMRARAVEGGEPYALELRLLRAADRAWRWHLGKVAPMRDDTTGEVRAWVGTAADIHDVREAEAALRASEARLRAAIALAPFPILLHAEDGEILQASEAWQEISGWRWPEDIPTIAD
jgi:PAS domain S-box-containing protein